MVTDRYEQGMTVRREVLGDAHVDRAVAGTTSFTEPFQDFLTRYAWGEVWSRPELDRRTRSAVTLAVLTALHCREEVGMHVRAALRNGLTGQEISEVLLHTALYAGLPAANEAFVIARRVLEEEGERASGDGASGAGTSPEESSRPGASGPAGSDGAEPDASGTEQSGQNTCPRCAGSGRAGDGPCPQCAGTGVVVEVVGDA